MDMSHVYITMATCMDMSHVYIRMATCMDMSHVYIRMATCMDMSHAYIRMATCTDMSHVYITMATLMNTCIYARVRACALAGGGGGTTASHGRLRGTGTPLGCVEQEPSPRRPAPGGSVRGGRVNSRAYSRAYSRTYRAAVPPTRGGAMHVLFGPWSVRAMFCSGHAAAAMATRPFVISALRSPGESWPRKS